MKKYALFSLLVLVLVLLVTGCSGKDSGDNMTDLTGQIVLDDEDFVFIDDEPVNTEDDSGDIPMRDGADVDEEDVAFVLEVTEEELVALDFKAIDPDGDSLDYEFNEPLNAQGRWQTQIGDEGRYLTTVTVSDGKLSTSEDVLIIVARANRAPTIECPESFSADEGELLYVDCNIFDEEGDDILISYEGWSTSSSKKTTFDDAGEYTVLLRASDGNKESTHEVKVVINNVNRAPVLEALEDMTVMETTTIRLVPIVEDPDGDEVMLSFSKPVGEDGVWVTDDGDAGTYEVEVLVTDGSATATETFTLTVTQINTAPVLKRIADIVVDEGDSIVLPVNAYDPEGDEIFITYSGFMDSDSYDSTFDDAGVYEQSVTVSDGVLSTTEVFSITIENKNRAPVFVLEGD